MTAELFANDYVTKLTAGCFPTDTVFLLDDPLPLSLQQSGQFRLLIAQGAASEYVIAQLGANTTTVNVTRGAEGSAARLFSPGALVEQVLTSGAILNALATSGGGGGSGPLGGDLAGNLPDPVVNAVLGGKTPLTADRNLADLLDAAAARLSLGLGSAAVQPAGAFDTFGAAASALAAAVAKAANLSDLPNIATARTNLGLGSAATHPSTDFASAPTVVTPTQTGGGTASAVTMSALQLLVARFTLTADHVCTITPAPAGIVKLEVTQDSVGGHTFSISDGTSTEMLDAMTPANAGPSVFNVNSPNGVDLVVE